jgi:hypothetical protein
VSGCGADGLAGMKELGRVSWARGISARGAKKGFLFFSFSKFYSIFF